MARSALSRHHSLAISAEQFSCKQIFVLGFVLGWGFFIRCGFFLYLFKKLGWNDSGDTVWNNQISVLILLRVKDIFSVLYFPYDMSGYNLYFFVREHNGISVILSVILLFCHDQIPLFSSDI